MSHGESVMWFIVVALLTALGVLVIPGCHRTVEPHELQMIAVTHELERCSRAYARVTDELHRWQQHCRGCAVPPGPDDTERGP